MTAPMPDFDGLIGHSEQVRQLSELIRKGSAPHALLFSGPACVGKRLAANLFAANLISLSAAPGQLAGPSATESMRLFRAGNHPDFHFLTLAEDKKDISVESVRELCSKLHLKPYYSRCSVAVIDNAHLLSTAACNALLMTLEEPPPHCHLILVTHLPHKLLETIVSRCQPFYFGRLSPADSLQILETIAPSVDEQNKLTPKLNSICEGSLEALQLEEFFDPQLSRPKNAAELQEHLAGLSSAIDSLNRRFAALLDPATTSLSSALGIAASLSAKDQLSDVVWRALRFAVRKTLRHAPKGQIPCWSTALLETLRAEQLVKERNLNAQIQLSDLLVKLSDTAANADRH